MLAIPRTFLLLLSLGTLAACSSTVTTGAGGHSSSSSGGTGSSSGVTCVQVGDPCISGTLCCNGAACYGGQCAPCYSLYNQCVCGGVAVGAPNGCNLGEACGLDAGPDGGDLPDGGACECKEMSQLMTCD